MAYPFFKDDRSGVSSIFKTSNTSQNGISLMYGLNLERLSFKASMVRMYPLLACSE